MVASLMYSKNSAKEVQEDYLKSIPTPEKTETYSPLPHWDFLFNALHLGLEILSPHGYSAGDSRIIVSKDDQKMFFTQNWNHPNDDGLNLSGGGRNSLDKSMSAAYGLGGRIAICDNMMMWSDVCVFRKHTGDVFEHLRKNLILTFHTARDTWRDMNKEKELFQSRDCDIPSGDHFLCSALESKALNDKQFKVALDNWRTPPYEEFSRRDVWGAYNAGTEGLKRCRYSKTLESHKRFHDFTREHFKFDQTAVKVLTK